MRYFFDIAYKGSDYHGWQRQRNALSIQEVLEDHLGTVLREKVDIVGSGRTDTGVHARQQFFHVDISEKINIDPFRTKLNSFLPRDISISKIYLVKEDAHARFDAVRRSYEYIITSNKDPFLDDYSYRFNQELDLNAMNKATEFLIGRQDFECFSRVKTDVNNFYCEIFESKWTKEDELLKYTISANRFLRGMVRAVVGSLLDVGIGKRKPEYLKQVIKSRDRKKAGRAVPAKGLYLTEVKYPGSVFI